MIVKLRLRVIRIPYDRRLPVHAIQDVAPGGEPDGRLHSAPLTGRAA
jgi:hypothetical protein